MNTNSVFNNIVDIGYGIAFVSSILLGTLLWIKSKRISTRIFVGMIMSVALWILTNFMADNATSVDSALFWARIAIVGPVILGPLMYEFSKTFPDFDSEFKPKAALFMFLTCIPFFFFLTSDYNISSVSITEGTLNYQPGPIYTILFIYFSVIFVLSTRNLYRTYQKSKGISRSQIIYLIFGIVTTAVIALITSLILPLLGYAQVAAIGPISVILFIGITTYSILRHRLFGIKWVIGGIVYSSLLALLPLATFYASYFALTYLWGDIFTGGAIVTGFFISILFIYVLRAFEKQITGAVSKWIVNPNYDPNLTAEAYSRSISSELDLHKITDKLDSIIHRSLEPESTTIIIQERTATLLKKTTPDTLNVSGDTLQGALTIVERIQEEYPIIFDEISSKAERTQNKEAYESIRQILDSQKIYSVFRIGTQERHYGYIAMGENKSKTALTIQDLNFIDSLITITAVAIERAILYEEVQKFNVTLQEKVDKATKELKLRNDELQDLYNNLEEIYQKEKDLMDVAGHEFRTPASILKNNLYLLKKRLNELYPNQTDEKIQIYIDRLIEGTDRQIKLVNTFLESARIDNQRFEIVVKVEDMQKVISDAVEDVKQFAKQKNLQVIFQPKHKKMFAEIDLVRIREVIDNLLNNSIKYTEEGYIEVSLIEKVDNLIFSVKDTGIGIKEEDKAALFKKFSRVENYIGGEDGSIVRPGGTGLGLYVARTIIEAHGGKIWVESEPRKGSTFTFEIPKKQPSYVKRVEGSRGKLESHSMGL